MSEAVMRRPAGAGVVMPVLGAASLCHLINDLTQALLPASYPILKGAFGLSFAQVGLLTLVYQLTASVLQPAVGLYTDRRSLPYSLPFGMACSMAGVLVLATAPNFGVLLVGAVLLGFGSSVFHPEASRIARLASGGAHGLAQSVFQVGGNLGTALGPLLAALVVLPAGQRGLAWFALGTLAGAAILAGLGRWYQRLGAVRRGGGRVVAALPARVVRRAMAVLIVLIFSKYVYLASFTSYYVFYLQHRFALSVRDAQLCQFVFFAAVAAGTVVGGPVGDRFGRQRVIWASILGVLPFTLALPYAGLAGTVALSVVIGLVLSSAFPAIVVYAQELVPGRVGMVSGLFFGLAFGVGGIAAAVLGSAADVVGIDAVYRVCAFLPVAGVVAALLPSLQAR